MATVIDRGFERVAKAGMVEIPLEEAQDLLRAAVGKATDQAVPDGEARAIAARTYHLAQALNTALAAGGDLSSFSVDEELANAIRKDVEGAQIVESVSEAMTRLAERLGTQKETAAAAAPEASAPPPPPAPEEPPQEAQAEPTATEEPAQAQEPTATATAQAGPDTGGQPPTGQAEETHWPTDLNTPADPDGLDDWGRDPQ